jgi:hypothetical protein
MVIRRTFPAKGRPPAAAASVKAAAKKPPLDEADKLAERLKAVERGDDIRERLVVDNRVFARITDGIYRRPSSALRELVFNAYDADATEVTIKTDSPRFGRMEVIDNGNGMTERSLSNLLMHIGGSSKRTNRGQEIGTASDESPDLSPGRRRLIGKIGIGLFAVAHLTTHFQIITKAKGENDWLVAEIWLKTFTEELLRTPSEDGSKPEFVTGEVVLTREPAKSTREHGTTITLFEVRPGTRDVLRRRELWESVLGTDEELAAEDAEEFGTRRAARPDFHIGFTDASYENYLVIPQVPWKEGDSPEQRFRAFYQSVSSGSQAGTKNPDIDEFLDEYFAMLWRLSLAAPLPYLHEHPLSTPLGGPIEVYQIQNKAKGRADRLKGKKGETAASKAGLAVNTDPLGGFKVLVDGVQLFRPVELSKELNVKSKRPVRQPNPLLFVGRINSPFDKIEADRSGGALEFEGYFYWNSVIVPKQNRGVLIRINDASGVLYDETFMDYQVSELNRLNQITGEIFVKSGMDAALNIDRESFNVSHPHYQYLAKWVHSSLRQITNLLKEASKKGREVDKTARVSGTRLALDQQLDSIWAKRADPLEERPEIIVTETSGSQRAAELRVSGSLAYDVAPTLLSSAAKPHALNIGDLGPIGVAKAVFGVLSAYGVLDKMSYSDQESMFEDVLQVLMAGDKQ